MTDDHKSKAQGVEGRPLTPYWIRVDHPSCGYECCGGGRVEEEEDPDGEWVKRADAEAALAAADVARATLRVENEALQEQNDKFRAQIQFYEARAETVEEILTARYAAEAEVAALRVERDELRRFWEEVGKHIDAACIGYNHPQIKAVFHLNSEQKKTIFDLTVRAEAAEAEVARLRAQLDTIGNIEKRIRDHYTAGYVEDGQLAGAIAALRAALAGEEPGR